MNSEPVKTREPLDDSLTPEQIQALIDERERNGASCEVVTEDGQKILVCLWPPL